MKSKLLCAFLIVFTIMTVPATINAQIKTKIFPQGIPLDRIPVPSDRIPVLMIKAPNEFINLQKSNKISNEYSNKFAITQLVDLNYLTEAKLIEEKDFTTYALTIHAVGALNISLEFNDFALSKNSVLSIYTQHELTDSITFNENNQYKVWATRVYQGNKLTISLRLPTGEKKATALKIDKVNFGFKKFGKDYFGNPEASTACNLNVVCPEAAGWENERNSVALIVVNGQESCTGSLVMNTCNTNRPYFLTANHCLSGSVANWIFQFQTWSATCIGNNGWREDIQFNGATLRANNAATDFALLELNQTPPANSGITYSGWNRNNTTPNGSVGIHHPAGDLMKFSRDFDPSGVSSWGGINNHWISIFEQGTVEPGSSGSPLYDMNHRIVGQLHGDQLNQGNFCAQRRGEYGKFDQSWTGGGTNTTRLSNWLDPNNTGAFTTNTTDVAALGNANATWNLSITGNNSICNSGTFTLNGAPAGATITWSLMNGSIPSNAATLTPNGNQVTLTQNYGSTEWVNLTATLTNVCGVGPTQVQKKLIIGIPDHLLDVMDGGVPQPENQIYPYTSYTLGANAVEPYYGSYISSTYPYASTASYIWRVYYSNPYGGNTEYYLGSYSYLDNPTFTFEGEGQYQIVLDIINNNCTGHSRSFSRTLTLSYMYGYTVSPNPSTNYIKISPNNATAAKAKAKALEVQAVELVDKMGAVKLKQKFERGLTTVNVSVSQLPNDIYTLRIFDGQKWHSHKIVVKH